MAYAMTKQGSLDNCVTYEFICDTIEDMNAIENRYRTIGSIAIVLQGASGLEVYISGSDKQWNSLSSIGSSSSDTAGLSIYICSQNEVSNGVPDVDTPDETTIYLVPATDSSSGNLYDEYIYVNDNWEKFGSGSTIDLSGYYQKPVTGIPAADLASGVIPDVSGFAPKASPVFTGSISLGRKNNTTIGENSIALGLNTTAGDLAFAEGLNTIASGSISHAEGNATTASNYEAHAEGYHATASGNVSHAEGNYTTASGDISHAEGNYTQATADYAHAEGCSTTASQVASHAEGYYTTASETGAHSEGNQTTASGVFSHVEGNNSVASGFAAHAEGQFSIANGDITHVFGKYNYEDTIDFPTWVANTSYTVGDQVKITQVINGMNITKGYRCSTNNQDANFTPANWMESNITKHVEIIGNGAANARSNAYALDWNGNGHFAGDIYVGCNADSTGGTKLPRIPEAPAADGSYILQTTVTNGTPTYTWVSLASLSGVTF